MGQHWRDLAACGVLLVAAVIVLRGPILRGEVFLPLDLLAHMPPWRYSYERTAVANTAPSDLILEYFPRRLIATRMVRQGHLPLWNPYVLGGMPLLADGYSALIYPFSMLFVLLPVGHAFGWFALFHLLLAGLGAYWLGRVLGLSPLAALFAGIGYMGNGFLMAWLAFPEFVAVSAWLPIALGCVERYEQRAAGRLSNAGYALATAIILALCVLCQLQLALYACSAVAIFWLGRRLLRAPRQLPRALAMLIGVAVCTLVLSAAQWLPTLELAADSQRAGATGGMASGLNLLQYIMPSVFGGPRQGVALGQPRAIPLTSYAGLLPLLLALAGGWRSRAAGRVMLLLLGCCILALLGTPRSVLSQIPLLNQLPGTDRWSMVLGLVVALLAGFGLQELVGSRAATVTQAHESGRAWLGWISQALCVSVIVILGGTLLRHLQLLTPASRYGYYMTLLRQTLTLFPILVMAASVVVLGLMIGLRFVSIRRARQWRSLLGGSAIVILALDLGWYGLPLQSSADPEQIFQPTSDLLAALGAGTVDAALSGDMVYPPTRTTQLLGTDHDLFRVFAADYPSFQPNLPSAFGFQDPRGYASLFSKRYLRFVRAWESKPSTDPGWVSIYLSGAYKARHLLDLMGVRYVLFNPQSPNEQLYSDLELIQRGDEGAIYRNPMALPRAFLVHTAETIADDDRLLARLTETTFPVSRTVLLSEPAPMLQPASDGSHESATVTLYTPTDVRVRAQVDTPAMLILSDTLYPGWYATINGQATKIYAADFVLRGVEVPAGTHEIQFYYRPWSVIIGMTVNVLGLFVAAAGAGMICRRSLRARLPQNRSAIAS